MRGSRQEHTKIYQSLFAGGLLGKAEEIGNQVARPLSLVHNFPQQAVLLIGEMLAGPEFLGVCHDRAKGMINLLRRSGDKVA